MKQQCLIQALFYLINR